MAFKPVLAHASCVFDIAGAGGEISAIDESRLLLRGFTDGVWICPFQPTCLKTVTWLNINVAHFVA